VVGGVSFGEELEIELDLPDLGPTRLPAIVRWLRPEGFGVQFGLLGAKHTHALANLVDTIPLES
jgi:type IV pilus assembly protein PilZ